MSSRRDFLKIGLAALGAGNVLACAFQGKRLDENEEWVDRCQRASETLADEAFPGGQWTDSPYKLGRRWELARDAYFHLAMYGNAFYNQSCIVWMMYPPGIRLLRDPLTDKQRIWFVFLPEHNRPSREWTHSCEQIRLYETIGGVTCFGWGLPFWLGNGRMPSQERLVAELRHNAYDRIRQKINDTPGHRL